VSHPEKTSLGLEKVLYGRLTRGTANIVAVSRRRLLLQGCRQEFGWNCRSVASEKLEHRLSSGELNKQSDRLFGDDLPAVDFAHADLAGGQQGPERHRGGLGGRLHGLRL